MNRSSLFIVWPYLWRSQWRRTSGHQKWAGADAMAALGLLVFLSSRLIPLARQARRSMAVDPTGVGMAMTSLLLALLQVIWLTSSSIGGARVRTGSFSAHNLTHLPLRERDLVSISGAAVFSQPIVWGYAVLSLCALPALLAGPARALGALAYLAHFAFMMAAGFAVSQVAAALLYFRRATMILGVVFVLAVSAAAITIDPGVVTAEAVRAVATRTPAGWAARVGATGWWLGIVWLLLAASALVYIGSFAFVRTYRRPVPSSRRAKATSWFPSWFDGSPLRAAVKKEAIYLGRTLDIRIGCVVSVAGALLLLLYREPLPWVPMLVFPLVIYNQLGVPHNSFGLDGKSVDRYRLLPLSGHQIVLSKNLAYLSWLAVEFLPMGLACLVKLGLGSALGCLAALLGYAFGTLVWGNHASIAVPAPRGFSTMDTAEQVGGMMLFVAAGIVMTGSITLLVWAWQGSPGRFVSTATALAVPAVLLWLWQLPRAGRAFERRAETMRAQLG